jgi:hypothetical protein
MSNTLRFPALNRQTLGLMFISGFFATIAFDLWGQAISPALGFATLSPHGLARSLLSTLGLPAGNFAAWNRIVGSTHWFVPSAIYGFGLWIFAIGGITTIAGLPFFLGFTGITWVALVVYGIVMVAVMRMINRTAI